MTHRPATFAALLGLARAGSKLGDYPLNAAKAVSTFLGVSLPRGSRRSLSVRGATRASRLAGVNIATRSALLGVTA
ncbi:hypothetical protein GA0115234_10193 [Streptomyces sp. DvalAA-43]|nr:hypothetical protein GA0115234_10193 [Streptomyces sp. DvalAA-43]